MKQPHLAWIFKQQIMKLKIFFLSAVLAAFGQFGCKDFVDGINEDPNNAPDASLDVVLQAAMVSTIVVHEGEDARLAALWARQFTGSDRQYSGYEIYNVVSNDWNWDKNYIIIKNADIVIEKAAVENNKLASGIAKVLKAHTFGKMTSLWGDVPFSEAAKFPEITDPKFDDQMAVYQGIQQLLDEAVSDLSGGPTNAAVAAKDFFFGGDAAAWEAVANTLKARFYLHVGDYANAAASANKGIADPSGDWLAPHPQGNFTLDMNMWFDFGQINRFGYMTANGAILPALLDPASTTYRGNAKTDEAARFNFVYVGTSPDYDLNYDAMWAANASYPLVTSLENHLILAEAEWRQGNTAAALDALNAARADLAALFPDGTYEAYEMADFAEGGIAGRPGESAEDALLHEILEEKYASLVGQIEVFNDLRRTDNYLGLPPTTGSAFPERFLISQDEIDANVNAPNPIPDLFEPTDVNK